MINELDIKNFFSLAKTKINLVEQVMNYYGTELAPNFNSFDFWHIDENKVSSIISFFLDPKEKHQQGDIYLKHFIKKFKLDFFDFNENDNVMVRREYTLDNGKRMDIIIYKNDFEQAIAIENKIHYNTTDQPNQIKDYLEFLNQKTKNNYCLIYLSPQGKSISDESISVDEREKFINEKKLKFLSYEEHMIECLNEFGNFTQNNRVKSFLKDFENKLRKIYGRKEHDQTASNN